MSTRLTYFLALTLICVLLLISLYLQFFRGFVPCPLCSLQRLCFAAIGLICLGGIFLGGRPLGRFIFPLLTTTLSLLGIVLAGRQVWLQHIAPVDSSECGVSLQYMLQILPLNEVIQKIFAGSAECSQRGWEFLMLDMAEWSLVWFILFLCVGLFLLRKARHQKMN